MPKVISGAEVFLEDHLDLVAGLRVGLITNPSGVDCLRRSMIDRFAGHPRITLVALFSPEHGIRGSAEAGEYVPFEVDGKTGLPIFSLYGQHRSIELDQRDRLDEIMRTFDTRAEGKVPEEDMIEDLDVLIFDLQDVGTRIYTYAATMAYCMRVCAQRGIRFLVLDRPNPINGMTMEGPVLEYPTYSSFVGLYPIPLRHGMTVGELALLFNDRFLKPKADLTVIPLRGWEREMWFDETGLPWVRPSPNLPTLASATVYPGQVLWEGTNASEGRGTARPFEQCGSPWIEGQSLADQLNRLALPGVLFQGICFRPGFSKFAGAECSGIRLEITKREQYRPLDSTLHILEAVMELYPGQIMFHEDYFDKIMGTGRIRLALQEGIPVAEIVCEFDVPLAEFEELRGPYLLYS